MELELDVDAIAGVLVISVRGALAGEDVEPVRRCLTQAIEAGRPVVLDLAHADRLDAEGVRALRAAHGRLATRMRVVVRRGGAIHATLKRAGLAHTLALHSSTATAMAAAAPAG